MQLLILGLAALVIVVMAWGVAAAAGEVVSRVHKPRGEMIDIGGRRLRLVCEGPRTERPVVWLEAGAFGGAGDFAAIQEKLAARGLRACAYDRAGMGYSDPGPKPRDGDAIAADLEALVAASGERGRFVLVGHSMAGLYTRQFAVRNPHQVLGLVLVDAVTPELIERPGVERFVTRMTRMARIGAVAGTLGLTKPLYWLPDRIGNTPAGLAEKRRGFISGRQSRTALAEVQSWRAAAEQTLAAGPLDPDWPVAVVTAGPERPGPTGWNAARHAPGLASRYGLVENVEAANHTTLLGRTHGDRVVAAVEHVLAAAGR